MRQFGVIAQTGLMKCILQACFADFIYELHYSEFA